MGIITSENLHDGCMHTCVNFIETLQIIVSTNELFDHFIFPSIDMQEKLFKALKHENGNLFSKLDKNCRTLFIRETGDNFRAAGKYPTEQSSFSILNSKIYLNCPYGQFINSMWRGSENHTNLLVHLKSHYDELFEFVKNGVDLRVDGNMEHFNIVIIFFADLAFVHDILGKCSSTSMYGCFRCTKKVNDWANEKPVKAKPQNLTDMERDGKKATAHLGISPNRNSTEFTKFHHNHYGQWVSVDTSNR